MINDNLDKVKSTLSKGDLSPRLRSQVKAIASEVEKDNATISKLVDQEEFVQAVAIARDVQVKVYNAQLALDGQLPLSN
jgi:5,10-methenyltetrahydromethanopterin hydrogenase